MFDIFQQNTVNTRKDKIVKQNSKNITNKTLTAVVKT